MARQVVLLRGINLGPRNRVSMAELRELLSRLGHSDVRTHLQSGNVVLTSGLSPEKVGQELQTAIADNLGVDTPVIVRTRDELAEVIARDPFGDVATDPRYYQVMFLSAELDRETARELEAADVGPERVVARGRELYSWHPNGVGRSPLAARLTEKRLGAVGTARNWNTVTKLLELADS